MRFEYTAVGHVTIDELEDGSRRPGGSALYGALQAARLGLRTLIVTRGRAQEIERLLAPYREELELEILPASRTTTLGTRGTGDRRRQWLLAWAGPITGDAAADTAILHIAPVARETPARWPGSASFVGLTAQGLIRRWPEAGGEISHAPLAADALPPRCDAVVLSEAERAYCAPLFAGREPVSSRGRRRSSRGAADEAGPLIAVTAGAAATRLYLPDTSELAVEQPAGVETVDDLGAGDVFAAALFVALHEGTGPREAIRFAHAAAAVRLGGSGPGAVGHRARIEERLRQAE
jgi:sugar/nucleoside kinase (ribokinase family)